MSEILNWIYVGGAVLLLFGAAVFVHEWGHYWMARRRGMKVEAFAIGFGPKIFGWTRDGIEYSWRWIPAGGFVRLPQMITSEALEGKQEDAEKIPPASPLSRILVAFAGPFMNLVFAFFLAFIIFVVGLPILENPSLVGYVDPASPEFALGIRRGDKIVQVNGRKTTSWQDVQMATVLAQTNTFPVVIERNGESKTYHLTAKRNQQLGGKFLNLDPDDHPLISDVSPGGAAEEAGLKNKDVVINFSGMPVASIDQLMNLIQKRAGEPTEIIVERNKQRIALTVTPKLDPATKKGRIGVALSSSPVTVYKIQRPGPDPISQLLDVWNKTVDTFSALRHSKETGVGVKDLSGPVGIFSILAFYVKTHWLLALNFLVLLNVNLAILNLLPIPVLDGGHILMSIFEALFRRPIPAKIQELATTVFALLLISFMLFVSFHDVRRIGLFKLMFEQETKIEQPNAPSQPAPAPAR
jgi:regulator of sigma E protease